jgi:uncharacterized 2Fe-2S/4Fe-4S cluster protein (DUF4445 family)
MTAGTNTLTLSPAGQTLDVAHGAALQDVLFEAGVEFPCGGRGRCKACRVRVLKGRLDPKPEERLRLTEAELADGWRLACRHTMDEDLELELAQWEMPVLSDHAPFVFAPRDGFGIAIDLGTTTIAAQLLDLSNGRVLAAETGLNVQAQHGADVLSRVEYALHGGQSELERMIRQQIGEMVAKLRATAGRRADRVVLVGNTVMHHLFCGIDVKPLAMHPFVPVQPGRATVATEEIGVMAEFLPCIGGLVGADILAGIVATGLRQTDRLSALVDLGTNGEVVVGNRDRLLCTSTAAGPAFEGARITHGMRAAKGAISEVTLMGGAVECRVIGGGPARGLCGSGLVDAVAAGLQQKTIDAGGRLAVALPLSGSVALYPHDVRELQLAKGAIAAGLRILTGRLGAGLEDIEQVYLAGAFGNYVNRASASRIGLLEVPVERITPSGNTALNGAKRALFEDTKDWDELAQQIEHVALNEVPGFQDVFAREMRFPDR